MSDKKLKTMPTKKVGLKLAITSTEEISSLMRFLNELEDLYKYDLNKNYLKNCDLSGFKIIKSFDKTSPELFLEDVLKHLSNIHFQRILWNADTMLINCADLTLDTLEFHPDIKRGLELIELQKKGKIFIKN